MNVKERERERERMEEVKSYSCDGLSYYFSIRRHSYSRSSTYFLLSNTERFADNFYSYSLCGREKKMRILI